MKKIALAISTEDAGDAAEAQNTRDQRDDQKRNDPAQHGTTLDWLLLSPEASGSCSVAAPTDRTIRRRKRRFRSAQGP